MCAEHKCLHFIEEKTGDKEFSHLPMVAHLIKGQNHHSNIGQPDFRSQNLSPIDTPACLAVVRVETVRTGLGKEVGARSQPQILSLRRRVETSPPEAKFHASNTGA